MAESDGEYALVGEAEALGGMPPTWCRSLLLAAGSTTDARGFSLPESAEAGKAGKAAAAEEDLRRSAWARLLSEQVGDAAGTAVSEELLDALQPEVTDDSVDSGVVSRLTRALRAPASLRSRVSKLVRSGVPAELHGQVWRLAAARTVAQLSAPPAASSYADYMAAAETEAPASATDIEKDLRRTFPRNAAYGTDRGIATLRRLLTAYAVRNSRVGYCQGMNFIAALLLLHCEEEAAFWLLATVVERLTIDWYVRDLSGLQADCRSFFRLLPSALPEVSAHLRELGLSALVPMLSSWWLRLFVNVLPLHITLRLWDVFFHAGLPALMSASLALLHCRRAALLACEDVPQLFHTLQQLRVEPPPVEELLDAMYKSPCAVSSTRWADVAGEEADGEGWGVDEDDFVLIDDAELNEDVTWEADGSGGEAMEIVEEDHPVEEVEKLSGAPLVVDYC
eukprot:PLAT9915.1.p1 GENE.PLAT9915.1~~PLAT9915.1.p1  ORF type:complete len:460 (-),score=130.89 PLAT9915.1:486-1841(-)